MIILCLFTGDGCYQATSASSWGMRTSAYHAWSAASASYLPADSFGLETHAPPPSVLAAPSLGDQPQQQRLCPDVPHARASGSGDHAVGKPWRSGKVTSLSLGVRDVPGEAVAAEFDGGGSRPARHAPVHPGDYGHAPAPSRAPPVPGGCASPPDPDDPCPPPAVQAAVPAAGQRGRAVLVERPLQSRGQPVPQRRPAPQPPAPGASTAPLRPRPAPAPPAAAAPPPPPSGASSPPRLGHGAPDDAALPRCCRLQAEPAGAHETLQEVPLPQLPELQRRRRRQPGQEEAAHLPRQRLRQGVRQDLAPQGPPPLARRGEALRLQLALLRQELHALRRAAAPPAHPHGGEAVRVHGVREEVHALGPPVQAREDPRGT